MIEKVVIGGRGFYPKSRYRLLHDWEIPGQEGTVRSCAGCPEVFNLGQLINNNYSYNLVLNRDLQFFSFGLMAKVRYKKEYYRLNQTEYRDLAKRWDGVFGDTLAFANGTGSETRHSYISGSNEGLKDITLDKRRSCGGNTHFGKREVQNSRGVWMVEIETFDIHNLPPIETVDPYTDYRVFWATNVYSVGHVGMFEQLGLASEGIFGVPLPLFGDDYPLYYPRSAMRKLGAGEARSSPYVL